LRDIKSRITYTPDDGYPLVLDMELRNWPESDRLLFRREAKFVVSLYSQYGVEAYDADFRERKIMERFAAEEAARS